MQTTQETETQPAPARSSALRLATVWLGGCSGCHMSFLDLDEFLIELAAKVELVYSPVMDVKEYPENVDVCLIEGAVCNEDNLELIHKVRQRTKVLVSFGDCAVTGNVPAIRNQLGLSSAESVLQRAYVEGAQSNPGVPKEPGIVPALLRACHAGARGRLCELFPARLPPAGRPHQGPADSGPRRAHAPKLEGPQLKFG